MADTIIIPNTPNWAQQAGNTISQFQGGDFRNRGIQFPDGTAMQPLAQQREFLAYLQKKAPNAPATAAYGQKVKSFEKEILAGESPNSENGVALSGQERRDIFGAGMESSKTQAAIRMYLQRNGAL